MKNILLILMGVLIGLIVGGTFYSNKYLELYDKYESRGEALLIFNRALKQCSK
jgi:hypothetical protein